MAKSFLPISLVLIFILLTGTSCKEQEQASVTAGVEANPAYQAQFGTPPEVKRGRAFARVGYLPMRETPDRVRAIPFYLYDDRNQLQQILTRLLSDEIVLPPGSPLFQPFPAGMGIEVAPVEMGTVTLALSIGYPVDPAALRAIALALTETSAQFENIDRVRITLNGEPLKEMPGEGFVSNPERIVSVGPPEAVMIAGMWEEGAELLSEILFNFDRPVTVDSFDLFDATGRKVEGDYYASAFNMAVVIHPVAPQRYRQGTLLKAEWQVTDGLGRSNKGMITLPLQRFEH